MTTIVTDIPTGLVWELINMPSPLNFEVYTTQLDGVKYFRPYHPIERYEFEEFFHFMAHCEDYTSERIVVKNPNKKSAQPVTQVAITKNGQWVRC